MVKLLLIGLLFLNTFCKAQNGYASLNLALNKVDSLLLMVCEIESNTYTKSNAVPVKERVLIRSNGEVVRTKALDVESWVGGEKQVVVNEEERCVFVSRYKQKPVVSNRIIYPITFNTQTDTVVILPDTLSSIRLNLEPKDNAQGVRYQILIDKNTQLISRLIILTKISEDDADFETSRIEFLYRYGKLTQEEANGLGTSEVFKMVNDKVILTDKYKAYKLIYSN